MFTEAERSVYGPYMDGSGGAAVWGDPLKISRLLTQSLGGNPNEVVKDLKSNDTVVHFAAMARAIPATVFAFELVSFDKKTGRGLMDDEVMKVFEDFCRWMSKKKGKEGPTPTGSNASDGHQLSVHEKHTKKVIQEIENLQTPVDPKYREFLYSLSPQELQDHLGLTKPTEESQRETNTVAFENHYAEKEKQLTDLMSSISRVGLPST